MLLTCAATFVDLIRSSDSQLDDRGRAQAVVHVGQKWSSRDSSKMVDVGRLAS